MRHLVSRAVHVMTECSLLFERREDSGLGKFAPVQAFMPGLSFILMNRPHVGSLDVVDIQVIQSVSFKIPLMSRFKFSVLQLDL